MGQPQGRPDHPPLPVPQEFAGLKILWELARRQHGVVFRARDAEGREFALKVFRERVEGLPEAEGHSYAISPFVDGTSLEEKKLPLRRGIEVIEKAARRLEGRTHGCVTPARVLTLRDGSVEVVGSEFVRGERTDDVRALGSILFAMAAGTPPSEGEVSLAARGKEVHPDLERIVSCALTGAYASPAALADDLARHRRGDPVETRALLASPKKKGGWIWAAAAAVLLAGVAVFFATRGGDPVEPETQPETVKKEEPRVAPKPLSEPSKPVASEVKPRPEPRKPLQPLTLQDEIRLQDECAKALEAEDPERLIVAAREALDRGSTKDWPCYYLALAHSERGELDKAHSAVLQALDRAPGNRDYLELRAHLHAFRGEAEKALRAFRAYYGDDVVALNRHILGLDRQIGADPRDGRARVLRGALYLFKRHHDAAAEDFAAAVDRGLRRALAWRARVELGRERRAEAAAFARAYLEEFPSDYATAEVRALLADLGAE